jgi:hypothetical protein
MNIAKFCLFAKLQKLWIAPANITNFGLPQILDSVPEYEIK